MAVEARHLSASLRFVDEMGSLMRTYTRIRPNIETAQVQGFLNGISALSVQVGDNAFLTVNTLLVSEDV